MDLWFGFLVFFIIFQVFDLLFFAASLSKQGPFEKGWWIPGSGFYFYFRKSGPN